MTSVNIPKDDVAVREARIKNVNTPSVDAVKQSAAATEVEPVNPHEKPQPPRTAIRQRSKKDRRQGERRKRQDKVLLDTRSHRERRKTIRRSSDLEARQETEKPTVNVHGIDEYT